MGNIAVVGLGLACLDILVRTDELPTWEHGKRLSAMAVEGGGPVATAIVATQRLGVDSGFIGTYGSDRLGAIKLQTLVENGVDVSRSVRREEDESQVVLVYVHAKTGERLFSGVSGSSPELDVSELDKSYITQAEYLHLDGFHAQAAIQAAKWMKSAGKKVMLDGSATQGPIDSEMKVLASLADILICGHGFGPALTGEMDLCEAGRLIHALGPEIVIQTEGKSGCYVNTKEDQFHFPAFDVPVIDTTGAGDVFHGAFLVGMLRKWDVRRSTIFSSAVAALKCRQISGRRGIPTYEETIGFLNSQGYSME